MGALLFILLAIAILCTIKTSPPAASSGELAEGRRRQLHRAARRARERNNKVLPWLKNTTRKRRK